MFTAMSNPTVSPSSMPKISINRPEVSLSQLDDDVLLAGPEIAQIYGVSPATVRQWRYTGTGPDYIRMSATNVRYRAGDVKRHLSKLRVIAAADGAAPSMRKARAAAKFEATEIELFGATAAEIGEPRRGVEPGFEPLRHRQCRTWKDRGPKTGRSLT